MSHACSGCKVRIRDLIAKKDLLWSSKSLRVALPRPGFWTSRRCRAHVPQWPLCYGVFKVWIFKHRPSRTSPAGADQTRPTAMLTELHVYRPLPITLSSVSFFVPPTMPLTDWFHWHRSASCGLSSGTRLLVPGTCAPSAHLALLGKRQGLFSCTCS